MDVVSANAARAIAYQDGVAKHATARKLTAHAHHQAIIPRFAVVAATVSAGAAIARRRIEFGTPDNTARSVPYDNFLFLRFLYSNLRISACKKKCEKYSYSIGIGRFEDNFFLYAVPV